MSMRRLSHLRMLARYLFNDVFRRRREPSGRWPPRFQRIFLSKLRCRTLGGTIRRIVACCGIGNQFGNYEMRAAGETQGRRRRSLYDLRLGPASQPKLCHPIHEPVLRIQRASSLAECDDLLPLGYSDLAKLPRDGSGGCLQMTPSLSKQIVNTVTIECRLVLPISHVQKGKEARIV